MNGYYKTVVFKDVTGCGKTVYIAKHPELDGCMSQGDTPLEAVENLKDAQAMWLEMCAEEGIEPPRPAFHLLVEPKVVTKVRFSQDLAVGQFNVEADAKFELACA